MWTVMTEEHGIPKALLLAAICQVCLYYADLYEVRRVSDRGELLVRIVQALGGASFILAAVYFWFPVTMIGRGVFLIAASLIVVLIVGWRVAFDWVNRQVGPTERLLVDRHEPCGPHARA